MTKLYLSTLNFVFSLSPNARIWDYINDVVAWPFFHPPFNSLLWADVYKIHNNGTAKGWSWNLNESVWSEYTMKLDWIGITSEPFHLQLLTKYISDRE